MVQASSALVIATALVISASSSFATHLRLSDITGLSRRDLEAVNPSYLIRSIPDLELDARGIAEFADIVGREVNELNERDIRETLVHVLKRYPDDGEGESPDDNDDPEIIDNLERRGVLEGADALLPRRSRKESKRQTQPMNIGRREPQVAPHLDPRVIYGRSHQGETKRNRSRAKRNGKGSGKRTASMSKPAPSTAQRTSKGPSRR